MTKFQARMILEGFVRLCAALDMTLESCGCCDGAALYPASGDDRKISPLSHIEASPTEARGSWRDERGSERTIEVRVERRAGE